MRKYLYAGALAGGFLLLGAAPAQADVVPAPQAGQQQDGGGLTDPLGPNGLSLDQPLGGSPLIDVNPGDNSILPSQDGMPAARTGLGQRNEPGRRAADGSLPALPGADRLPIAGRPASGLPVSGLPVSGRPVSGGGLPTGALGQLPISNLLGGGLPLVGGLLPDGMSPIGGMTRSQEAGLLGGGLPLLGGLGGLLPASPLGTLPALSGMPAGGTAIPIDDQPAPARNAKPAQVHAAPAQAGPASAAGAPAPAADPATANDARLHEEPTDPEGRAGSRTFSAGRPVAGVDPQFR